jgi:GWxTD domain-containing protein
LLNIKFVDSKNQELGKAFKSFYVYNDEVVTNVENFSDLEKEFVVSEYYKMTEDEIENEYNKAIYLMPFKDKEQYEALKTIEGKRLAMFKFWKSAAQIVSKKEYYSRIEYSNKYFKSDYREGWKTDRGRIYCIYGKYDDIERYPYEGPTRAYEIWTYNKLQGGAVFVFIDMSSGFGDYILVHSTAQNEIRDDAWQEKLSIR